MLRHLLFRVFSFFPTLLIGIIALFLFRQLGPGAAKWEERVELQALESGSFNEESMQRAKADIRRRLQLDQPAFYLTIYSGAVPTTPGHFKPHEKDWIRIVSIHSGETEKVLQLAEQLKKAKTPEWNTSGQLRDILARQKKWLEKNVNGQNNDALRLIEEIEKNGSALAAFLPALRWNGTENQFHHWFVDLLQGNLGRSWRNNEDVGSVIGRSLLTSVRFTLPAFLLIFLSAYWLVIVLSYLKPSHKHVADQVLYFIDLLPLFGWGLLLMIVFASGLVFNWFPSFVAGSELTGGNFWEQKIWPYVLPVLALWLASFPYVTKQMDQAFQKTARQPFILAAYARGLTQKMIIEKYRLRYSFLPAITLVGEYLLAVLSGALVVEVLFSIPGIGKLMADSVYSQDFPVVTAVVLLLMATRMLSYLITDLLYYSFDPRIRFRA